MAEKIDYQKRVQNNSPKLEENENLIYPEEEWDKNTSRNTMKWKKTWEDS